MWQLVFTMHIWGIYLYLHCQYHQYCQIGEYLCYLDSHSIMVIIFRLKGVRGIGLVMLLLGLGCSKRIWQHLAIFSKFGLLFLINFCNRPSSKYSPVRDPCGVCWMTLSTRHLALELTCVSRRRMLQFMGKMDPLMLIYCTLIYPSAVMPLHRFPAPHLRI